MRRPVDVEPSGVTGLRPPFEHVEPERIVGAADAHVIRNEVENSLESLASKRMDHRRVFCFRSELWIELRVVRDVVAVRAARARLEEWREIDMAHAEPREIGRDGCGLIEAEAGTQLQPVSGAGGDRHDSTLQRTLH